MNRPLSAPPRPLCAAFADFSAPPKLLLTGFIENLSPLPSCLLLPTPDSRPLLPTPMPPMRVFNFSPGPAVMPLSVLEKAQRELVSYPGFGMSVLEMSHRGPGFLPHPRRHQAAAQRPARHPRQLQNHLPARRLAPAVLDGPAQSAPRPIAARRLPRHRLLEQDGPRRSQARRQNQHRLGRQTHQLRPPAQTRRS